MTGKFKVGDRVRIVMTEERKEESSPYDGAVGEVTAVPEFDGRLYTVVLDNVDLVCRLWGEEYLETITFEIGELVEVKGYGKCWDGAVGQVTSSDKTYTSIKLVQDYEHFTTGLALTFSTDCLVRTSIPIKEEASVEKSKQELALTAAYHTFKFYQSQHEAKGKNRKARANELLANMMLEALDDLE